nr:MAG TPA: hypothetical protein [Bacteriophage sp.]
MIGLLFFSIFCLKEIPTVLCLGDGRYWLLSVFFLVKKWLFLA